MAVGGHQQKERSERRSRGKSIGATMAVGGHQQKERSERRSRGKHESLEVMITYFERTHILYVLIKFIEYFQILSPWKAEFKTG